MHEPHGRFSETSRPNITLFIHIHVSSAGWAKASSVQYLFTNWLLASQKTALLQKSTGLQTMYTTSVFKSAGVNSDQLWLCPCRPKTVCRTSMRGLQQMILHHCTFCTSANSFGMKHALYSERGAENRDINCKDTLMCTHYESNYHYNKIGLKGLRLHKCLKKKKSF